MKIAFAFPGQGARRVHEAVRAALTTPIGRDLLGAASEASGAPLASLAAQPALLDRTEILQPVLTAISLAIDATLRANGVVPELTLGHSAGEIAAWAATGSIDARAAVAIAAARGRAMSAAAPQSSTRANAMNAPGLVAIPTSDPAEIERFLRIGAAEGAIAIAAHNAPDETVLTGEGPALRAILAAARGGAVRVAVSGPWHSPLMRPAADAFRAALDARAADARPPACAFVTNKSGEILRDAPAIRAALVHQITSPVAFRSVVATAMAASTHLVIVGPGAVLRALVRRNARGAAIFSTDTAAAIDETIRALGALREDARPRPAA